jgi:hypothetical protein
VPHKDPAVRKAYLREHHKRWYEANKDQRQAQIRQYKADNRAKVDAQDAEYRSRPDVRARNTELKREWRELNRERDRKTRRLWSKLNRDRIQQYNCTRDRQERSREYYAANREYYAARRHLRYIVQRDGVTAEQFELMAAFARK